MKNFCNYETSIRLKAAGFPQPRPEAGQTWYMEGGAPLIVLKRMSPEVKVYLGGITHMYDFSGAAFAPTAADILQELGWGFFKNQAAEAPGGAFESATKPEAAASAWLFMKNGIL